MAEVKIGIGTLINNRYQIQEILGQGGFGRTYLASDIERFNEQCVLKEFVPTNTKRYAMQKARELFEREARTLYKINHPQIPKFLALFESSESLFIVQEYIKGKTYFRLLNERLAYQGQPFPEREVSQWLQDLLPVLDYLHRSDIVHRDISLDNIMLPNGQLQPVLIDFGLVKQRVSQIWELTSNNANPMYEMSFVGKLGYSPPEQIRMGQCYPCSDLYSLAVSAIVLLTGKEPSSLMNRSLEWQWRSHTEVSDSLADILDKMLAEKPDNRYQSAQEILALLQPESLLFDNNFSLQFELEIDETNKNLQVAEIEETDYFKQLQAQADFLRNSLSTDTDLPFPSDLPVSTLNLELNPEAIEAHFLDPLQPTIQLTPSSLQFDSDFLERCQQTLSRYIGVMATCILEDTIDDNPDFSKEQLIDALAAEIPNPQQSAEFKQSISKELIAPSESAFSKAIARDSFEPFESDIATEGISPEPDLPQLDSIFLTHCQQALSRYIGVMATCILEDTIDDNPDFSKEQLIDALAAQIPNPQQAAEFKKIMTIELETPPEAKTPQPSLRSRRSNGSPSPSLSLSRSATPPQPAPSFQLTQALADRCQQELTRYIGPMAKYLVEDTLDDSPNLSVQQLIEALAEKMPNPKHAEEFRQRLLLSLKS